MRRLLPVLKRFTRRRPKQALRRNQIEGLEARYLLTGYVQMNLVADQAGAALLQDPNLINPWGLAVGTPNGDFSVADNGAAVSTFYNGAVAGSPFAKDTPLAQIPGGFPTADVFNDTTDFVVSATPTSVGAPATYLYGTQTGKIAAWNGGVLGNQAQVVAQVSGADFTGLAIAANNSANELFAADFQNGKLLVFDHAFHPVTPAGSFTDPNLPSGFAPFNVQFVAGKLFVTYAKQQNIGEEGDGSGAAFMAPSASGGIVDEFNTDGTFAGPFSSDPHLNAPWGMAQVTAGQFAGDILVGNFGDGRINVFDSSGNFVAQLDDTSGNPISIAGLRGLAFGNDNTAGAADALFFNAGGTSLAPESTAVLVLDPASQGALTAVGNATVNVAGGGEIVVDSTNAAAVVAIGNGHIAASQLDITGTPGARIIGNAGIQGTIDAGVPPMADPLASLPTPAVPTASFAAVHVAGRDNVTLQPGMYAGGIHVSGQANVSLLPGIYYLGGGGLTVTGQGHVVGNGVTIYNASQVDDDAIRVVGQGNLLLSAPNSGTYRGIAIFETRASGVPLRISGNGIVKITGAIYAAGAPLDLSGNGQLLLKGDLPNALPAEIIVRDLNVFGNGDLDVQSTASVGLGSGVHGLFGTLQAAGIAPLVATSGKLTATEGQVFSGPVAAFAATAAANFTATIDWGDGTTTSGTITATRNGGFLVIGSHTYAEEATEDVKVTISDTSHDTVTANDTLTVADAPLDGFGTHFLSAPGQTRHGVVVATFTDPGGAEPVANYTASIDWGDGTTDAGTITFNNGVFTVSGSHVYAHPSRFNVAVTVTDDGGATTTIHSFAGNGHAGDDDQFLEDAFEDLLLRPIDAGGETFFANAMQNGLSSTAVATTLTTSDEFLSNRIDQAYLDFLGRHADSAGLQFWLSQMKQGMTDEQLDAAFIGSPEFFAHSGGTNRSWVDETYFDLLGRAPDAAGEAFWENVLDHGANRGAVAIGFAVSTEHEGNIVQNDYRTFLGRDAASSEVGYWVGAFQRGLTNEQVIAGFVGSTEYFGDQTADD